MKKIYLIPLLSIFLFSQTVYALQCDDNPTDGVIDDDCIASTLARTSGNTATSTALAANGGNCDAGSYALGVDASGAAEGCTAAPTAASLAVDDLITLSGVASGAVNLGAFTGSTIADNQTIKAAIQALETFAETLGGGVDFTAYDDVTWGAAVGGSQIHTYDTGAGTDPAFTVSDTTFTFNKGLVALSFTTSGADGTHYVSALNTAALSSTATDGNLAFLSDRYYLGDGTDYNDYLISKELIDTEAEFESAFFAILVPGEVDDTPSDGNTTQPASSNSVFDGLALKADKATFPVDFCVAISDEATALTIGTAKVTFRAPYAFTLTNLRASVNTAPTDATLIIDVNEGGATVMTTDKIQIETTELTSVSATTQPGLTDTAIADDASMTIDIDQVGSTIAGKGAKVCFYGTRSL